MDVRPGEVVIAQATVPYLDGAVFSNGEFIEPELLVQIVCWRQK